MKKSFSNVRGTSDFDVSESLLFKKTEEKARRIFKLFGYEEIILPFLEEKELFIKSVGEATDIIERQIFKIEGKDIVLRPEGTAPVIRYYLQNSLHKKSDFYKFFYTGAMFRGERPQKGRLRQFHHLGAEAIGSNSFYLDAEMISLSLKILDDVGIKEKTLLINSLGCQKDKDDFSKYIKEKLKQHRNSFCEDCSRRMDKNPLRILDCKKESCQKLLKDFKTQMVGPTTCLCSACAEHFTNLWHLLNDIGIDYKVDRYLVRGLDYYTNTVFEITSGKLGSKDAIGAGGRYNNLVKFLGGPDIPAIGFALGLERILLALDNKVKCNQSIDVFVAVADKVSLNEGFDILTTIRDEGISCDYDYCGKSLKGQLRFAQKKGAKLVVILGQDEAREGNVVLKDMVASTQDKIKKENLTSKIKTKLGEVNKC